jgi:hypothetical protein
MCDCESELLCNHVMCMHDMLHFCLQKETVTLNMDPQSGQDSCCWVEEDNITSIQLSSMLVKRSFRDDVLQLHVGFDYHTFGRYTFLTEGSVFGA